MWPPPSQGNYAPPLPPPLPPRNGSAPNPPPLPPRSAQYSSSAYPGAPPSVYQTSPYGYQAVPVPVQAPAAPAQYSAPPPQALPYFPPPPTAPGKPPPAQPQYSPQPPSSSFGSYSTAPVHSPQVSQSPVWSFQQPVSYAASQPPMTQVSHPPPTQSYGGHYPPPAPVQYSQGPPLVNATPTGPPHQPQYAPSTSTCSPTTYAPPPPPPPPVSTSAPSQQQPYGFVKPVEYVTQPPIQPPPVPVLTPSHQQQQLHGLMKPQQYAVPSPIPPPSVPVSAPPQQQSYGFVKPEQYIAQPPTQTPSVPVSTPSQQRPYESARHQQYGAPPPIPPPYVAVTSPSQQPHSSVRPLEYTVPSPVPPPSVPASAPSQQQSYGLVKQQQYVIQSPIQPPSAPISTPSLPSYSSSSARPLEYTTRPPVPPPSVPISALSQEQSFGFVKAQAHGAPPPVPPPSTRPLMPDRANAGQQQGHITDSPPAVPPLGPPTSQPVPTVNAQDHYYSPAPTAHRPEETQGAQTTSSNDHPYYPPFTAQKLEQKQEQEQAVHSTTQNDHYYSPLPTTQNLEQKHAPQETQRVPVTSNSSNYNPPPPDPTIKQQNAEESQETVTTSTEYYHPPIIRESRTEMTASTGHHDYPHSFSQISQEQKEGTQVTQIVSMLPGSSYYDPPISETSQEPKERTQVVPVVSMLLGSSYYDPPSLSQTSQEPKEGIQVISMLPGSSYYDPPPPGPPAQAAIQTTTSNDDYYRPPPQAPISQQQITQDIRKPPAASNSHYYHAPSQNSAPQKQAVEQPNLVTASSTSYGSAPPPLVTETGEPSQQTIPQDPLTVLSAQMNTLNVRVEGHDELPQGGRAVMEDDGPRPPAAIKATGTPSDVVIYCPKTRGVEYSLYWYHLADVPEYLICTRCHADHIEGTSLASQVERVKRPDGVVSKCSFWYPRVKEVLWPQAVQNNDMGPLRDFMKKRLSIPSCAGRAVVKGADGIKWYGMKENEINGLIGCEACYEDHVAGTAFQDNFTQYREQGADDPWVCDLALPYLSSAVLKMAKEDDWTGFVEAANRRLLLPLCEGKSIRISAVNWYLTRRTIDELHICEACYLDKLALTRFGDEFEVHVPAQGLDNWIANFGREWTCNLSNGNIPMSVTLDLAIYRRDFNVFWNAAKVITSLVPCTANGIIRGNWWTLVGGCDGLSVCEACHAGILLTTSLDQFFEPVERDREATIICTFCAASPRFTQFINKLSEAEDRRVFSYYADFVKRLAGVPTCPGIGFRKEGLWWGYPEALACNDCFMTFVIDTPLGDSVPVKAVSDERPLCCQMWSPRMRNMWLQACEAGVPGPDESTAALDEFRAFGKRRMEVYNEVMPQIEFIKGMREIKMMNAMNQGMLSVMYSGMNSFAAVSGTTDGNLHGNSSLGWYETEHGATSAQMRNNMQAGMADANRADDWVRLAQLTTIWKEVE